jgi:hypothetical protein
MGGPRYAAAVAAAWGFAEATLFFIVPDVWLSLVAARSPRAGMRACAWALAGALAGGALMYGAAAAAPETVRGAVLRVPAISATMVEAVRGQLTTRGLGAVLVGPAQGRPYKIYASEWGASRRGLAGFLAVSVPARLIRFLLSVVVAAALARALAPWTRRRAAPERAVLLAIWSVFYLIYFRTIG